ncbi:tyrosine-type recombinase/integrase [Agrobacterium tumefaciens]|uniref:tyrosine-type recombinase/integrase n=1 Tax=Agrobacterium tumefaciens TaxID=358 RepID=UPI0021D25A92|nr:tyrosine-type recombinase/integrase [Agrobacterium tumefaciens]UXS52410.1 tyrosine-type recombinase/integrase [Agrobacterium tumefaciens]UXS62656.1 tyrosine-type recombinase/integrase [Agrobacterium tumefaciens]
MINVANINLPYIEKNKSRHGSMRYYLRIDGKRLCRLPDNIDSEEFSSAYWKAREEAKPLLEKAVEAKPLSSIVRPNSFRWLCMEYMRSNAFISLDETTRTRRRKIMEGVWEERLSDTDDRLVADIPLPRVTVAHIEILRDRKRDAPFAADERLKVLRQVFDTKKDGKAIVPNIARLVQPFNAHSDGHATATPEDIEKFIAHHGTSSKAVLYVAIQMYTGLRVSDLAVLGPQHRRKDAFKLRLFKNRNRTPVDIDIAIHPILEAVLSTHKIENLTYLVTEFGKPFSVKGLGNRISDWWRQAGMGHLTSHSVRKGLATDVAHNEATDSMLEAMFGWKDGKTSKIYTRNAERARLARQTVERINWDGIGSKLLPADDVKAG